MIMSVAMMFKYSFNEVKAAQIIASSINSVIESGFCTKDIPIKDGKVIGTSELTKKSLENFRICTMSNNSIKYNIAVVVPLAKSERLYSKF